MHTSSRRAPRALLAAYPLTVWAAVWFLVLNTSLRGVLAAQTWQAAQLTVTSAMSVLGTGLLFDTVTLALMLPVLMLVEAALGRRRGSGALRRGLVLVVAALLLFALGFGVMAEWFFWDEFGVRFNFIAVDYLVYTHEVIGNIRESFPVGTLLGVLGVLTLAVVWMSHRWLRAVASPTAGRGARVALWVASLALAIGVNAVWSIDARRGANEYQKELSANGLYSMGYAFGNNSIDYFEFYPTTAAPATAKREDGPRIVNPTRPRNVVIITMESLSSSYMAHGGGTLGITPHLDKLADEGLFLSNLYATGNRTVRGLEATSLAIPPLPGHAIIWRDDNQNLETLGAVLTDHGYASHFMYGGYARFDNMDQYFSDNHYQSIDRGQFPEKYRGFGNIWGLADEHLYDYALARMDQDAANGKPFLMHLMTTSNHTPFTFPDGRVDLPRGRNGAVKYADYAVGRFIEMARSKPWFKDTVFVLVADHCASSKGRTSLPPENYHIPAILYSPAHIAPHTDARMASQIDLVPTVLDLLGLSERERFAGRSVLRRYPDAGRAFIATYQKLGFLTPEQLVILSPGRKIEDWHLDAQQNITGPVAQPNPTVTRAIEAYQGSAERARTGALRHIGLGRQ